MHDTRSEVRDTAVMAVYRHVRSDAATAASHQHWDECHRLMAIARQIERAYPGVARRARFAGEISARI